MYLFFFTYPLKIVEAKHGNCVDSRENCTWSTGITSRDLHRYIKEKCCSGCNMQPSDRLWASVAICNHLGNPVIPLNTRRGQWVTGKHSVFHLKENWAYPWILKVYITWLTWHLEKKNLDDVLSLLHQSSWWKMSVTDFPQHSFFRRLVGPSCPSKALLFKYSVFFCCCWLLHLTALQHRDNQGLWLL